MGEPETTADPEHAASHLLSMQSTERSVAAAALCFCQSLRSHSHIQVSPDYTLLRPLGMHIMREMSSAARRRCCFFRITAAENPPVCESQGTLSRPSPHGLG